MFKGLSIFVIFVLMGVCFNEVVQSQSIGNGLETPECMGNVVYISPSVFDTENWGISESDLGQRANSLLLESDLLPVNTRNSNRRPDNCHILMNRGVLNIFVNTFPNVSQVSVTFYREVYYLVGDNEFKKTRITPIFIQTTHGISETNSTDIIYKMIDENLGRFIDQYKITNNLR